MRYLNSRVFPLQIHLFAYNMQNWFHQKPFAKAFLKAKLRLNQASVSIILINLLTGQIGGGHFDLSPVLDASQIMGQDNEVCPHTGFHSPNISST